MTIQQCRYVLAIARSGSMNEAAKKLLVSQASLSAAVRELEDEFGITFDDSELTSPEFGVVGSLVEMIEKKIGEK